MVQVLCILDTQDYKHILRICNTYWFSTATMVTRTPLNVTFIPGLSLKIPNNLNKSFADLLWGYRALCPATYSSPIFIHCSQRFFQFCKHSWNASCGILHSSSSEFPLISWIDSNRHPISRDFSWVKRKKSVGVRSGEYGGWGTTVISCFVRKLLISREECVGASSRQSSHFFLLHKSGLFLHTASLSLFITFR
jgi:hypothetical protein